jgi:glycosyltransferase involved in cell wall biosynthesis
MHDAAAEMVRRGWRVVVLAAGSGYEDPSKKYPGSETLDGVTVRRFPLSSFGKSSIAVRLLGGALFLLQATIYALFVGGVSRILVSTSPPMCGIAGVLLSRLKGAPVKFWAMDINPDQLIAAGRITPTSLSARVFDWLNRSILRRASHVIALDRFMAQSLERKTPIGDKTAIIPPWPHIDKIDEALAHDENPFRKTHDLQGKFVVMYSGNMSPSHPVTTLLEASLRLQDRERLLFLFVGGGLGKAEIEAFIEKHRPPNIRLLPYQPLSELRYSLSAADVHLVAMGNEMVGVVHPCKVYGAMAVGRPLLLLGPSPCHVSDILGENDIGWQVAHGDVDGADRLLREILDTDPGELAAKGKRAQASAGEQYSRATLTAAFCDVLEAGA